MSSAKPTKLPSILCPTCGVRFSPSQGNNICPTCIISSHDITQGVSTSYIINFCRFCKRYNRPPWVHCERESRELLALCLKKIKGINKLKLVDACFLWTQPHSRRIKVQLTLSQEISNASDKIQQKVIVTFVEQYQQCDDCRKEFTPHTWVALVQVRQHVEHKKTFYLLEQLILRNKAHIKVQKVEQQKDGVDFHFKSFTHAQRFVEFLTGTLPTTVEKSKQLISHDESSNTYNYKYTFSVVLPKICRDDVVILPKKLTSQLGGCSQLCLCWKVAPSGMYLLDLASYKTVLLTGTQYFLFQDKIEILTFNKFKSLWQVMDSEPLKRRQHNSTINSMLEEKLTKVTVRPLDTGEAADLLIQARCHLGNLQAGDEVQCIDLRHLNYYEWMNMNQFKGVDDVIVIRRKRQEKKERMRVKRLQVTEKQGKKKKKQDKEDKQFQEFLDEVQMDPEMKKMVVQAGTEDQIERVGFEDDEQEEGIHVQEKHDETKIEQPEAKSQQPSSKPEQSGENAQISTS